MENTQTKTEEQKQDAEERVSGDETKPACGCCGGKNKKQ
jgi:hypothetical protein